MSDMYENMDPAQADAGSTVRHRRGARHRTPTPDNQMDAVASQLPISPTGTTPIPPAQAPTTAFMHPKAAAHTSMDEESSSVVVPYGHYQAANQVPSPQQQSAVPSQYSASYQPVSTGSSQYQQPQMPMRNDDAAYPSDYWQGYPGQYPQRTGTQPVPQGTPGYQTGAYPQQSAPTQRTGAYPQQTAPSFRTGAYPQQPASYQQTGSQQMLGAYAQQTGAQQAAQSLNSGMQQIDPQRRHTRPQPQTGAQGYHPASQYSGNYPVPQHSGQIPVPSGWSGKQQRVPSGQTAGNNPDYMMGSGELEAWPKQPKKLQLKLPPLKLPPIPPSVRKWLIIILLACIVTGTLYIVIRNNIEHQRYEALVAEVSAYDDRFCQGVYVDGIHLGGMTRDDAYNAVMAQAYNRNDSWHVQLTLNGQVLTEIRASQLGMKVDVKDAMNDAWQQGHVGDYETRQLAMQALVYAPYSTTSTEPGGDTTVIDSILNDLANQLFEPAQDAYMISFSPQLTDPFEFSQEKSGRSLNTEALKEKLYNMVANMESGAVELELTELKPTNSVEQLRATQFAVRATATTDISTSSDDNRNNNIRRAFALISGTAIQSGGSFSFNNTVGERTERNGFFPAPEYVYGQVDTGIGGGVCQASTTIYQAAIYAGMNIITRHPHSMRVNYADYGKDATVYWYSNHKRDLVFQNTSAYPIYIKASVESNPNNRNRLITKVTIYGQPLEEGVTYNFVTEEEVLPAPTEPEVRADKNGEYVVYADEPPYEYQTAKDGTKVTSYRAKYIKGVEVERIFLATDTYPARPQILYTGVTIRPLETILPPQ